MNKSEFIDILKESLEGEISTTETDNNIRYYNDYIDTQYKNGKSYDNIFMELGDPRLIAKTIIDTYNISRGPLGKKGYGYQQSNQGQSSTSYNYSNRDNKEFNSNGSNGDYRDMYKEPDNKSKYSLNTWYNKFVTMLITIAIIIGVIYIGGLAIRLFFSIGIPILIIIFIYKMISR